jgi:hypothetical protein
LDTKVAFWLIALMDVIPSESKFSAKFRLVYKFRNPNLSNISPVFSAGERNYYDQTQVEEHLPGQSVELQNALEYRILQPSIGDTNNIGLIFSDAECEKDELKLEVIYQGVFKHLFELNKFPFDEQTLKIRCVFWRKTQADFSRNFKEFEINKTAFDKKMCDQPDYSFINTKTDISGEPCVGHLTIKLLRKPWYYTISTTLSLWFILSLALATFLMPTTHLTDRASDTITLLLTVIAVKFVIASDVPKVPYFTSIDIEVYLSFIFLLFVTYAHTQVSSSESNLLYGQISLSIYVVIMLAMVISPIRFLLRRKKMG